VGRGRLVEDDAAVFGQAIGTGTTPAASENAGETPMITMSRMLLARKQSLGSQVMETTELSEARCRFTTKLVAACHEEQTILGHSIRFGVINTPLHIFLPCSHTRPEVIGSVVGSFAIQHAIDERFAENEGGHLTF
jgi:hypothetical protein